MVAAIRKRMEREPPSFIRDTDPSPDKLPTTFVDTYTKWASSVTDAPEQYHRVTSIVMLSTLMTPYISLETSYGEIKPNIWAMILAGTTITRKSTSMDLALKMLDDVLPDYMLATDGSPEGLLAELAYRDGKISLFHRDEITGFMSHVTERAYMSGLLESFTRLYDCKREKRLLRRESIEIKEPYLIFLAGGIKTRMEEIVGMEHIRSGFLPRFLFVTGSTTAEKIRPIGPPSHNSRIDRGVNPRDKVLDDLFAISNHYLTTGGEDDIVKIGGLTKLKVAKPKHIMLDATDEVWERIRILKDDAIKLGERSSAPELFVPLYDRLSTTVIKVAILLAGARLADTIHLTDLHKAIHLSQEWMDSVTDFAQSIESAPDMDKWEKKVDKIIRFVKEAYPDPVTQTDVMKKFRIRKKDIGDIEATMIARGIVNITPYPYPFRMKGGLIEYRKFDDNHTRVDAVKTVPPTPVEREDSYVAARSRYERVRAQRTTVRMQRSGPPSESDIDEWIEESDIDGLSSTRYSDSDNTEAPES